MRSVSLLLAGLCLPLSLAACLYPAASAQLEDMGSLGEEQVKERAELQNMKDEIGDIKKTMSEAAQAMSKLNSQLSQGQVQEFHLVARETSWEISPGVSVKAMAYNQRVPGPVIRVTEGDQIRIVLHNQLPVPTSLYFHGLVLPHGVDGLPRRGAGLVGPGETYGYQFAASRAGTVWYHPQVIHAGQIFDGLSGALVVEPRTAARTYTKDYVLVLGEWQAAPRAAASAPAKASKQAAAARKESAAVSNTVRNGSGKAAPAMVTYFTVNGKTAPEIPPIEVKGGDRLRLRVINAARHPCPLYLTGHRFEIMAVNGSEPRDVNVATDMCTLQPGDRFDLELVADNPGVWSLSSLLPDQASNDGAFPGGIACVVRYTDLPRTGRL